jgi:hypothetical protein
MRVVAVKSIRTSLRKQQMVNVFLFEMHWWSLQSLSFGYLKTTLADKK